MGKLVLIKPGAGPVTTELAGPPPYELVRELVGGLIEVLPMKLYNGEPAQFFGNEEGQMLGLKPNLYATDLLRNYVLMPREGFLGNLVILVGRDVFWD